jgi:hypothetical protein
MGVKKMSVNGSYIGHHTLGMFKTPAAFVVATRCRAVRHGCVTGIPIGLRPEPSPLVILGAILAQGAIRFFDRQK